MLWAVSCVDKPNTAAIREEHLVPHRNYLQSQKRILVLARATQTDDGKEAIGSLFVVNANSRQAAKAFSDGDPFTKAGVFSSVTVTRSGAPSRPRISQPTFKTENKATQNISFFIAIAPRGPLAIRHPSPKSNDLLTGRVKTRGCSKVGIGWL